MDFELNTETIVHLPKKDHVCVTSDTSVRDVLSKLQEARSGCMLVVDDDKLVGIFTERDALRRMATGQSLDEPVGQSMVRDVVSLEKSDTVATAIEKMASGGYRRLPVVEDGKPCGLLSVTNILHYLVEHFPQVVYTLPPNPHHSTNEREGA